MSQNFLNSVKMTAPNLAVHDLSHDVKLSCNMGQLVPVLAMECVPGDRIKCSVEAITRFAPLVSPMMHRVNQYFHWFFVPNRLIWKNWENYITNTIPSGQTLLPAHPYITMQGVLVEPSDPLSKLPNYLGIPYKPIDATDPVKVSALPFAAYQKIYMDYYRDQNLVAEYLPNEGFLKDGENDVEAEVWCALKRRAWTKDYFTAALPFAQKGEPVDIPLGETSGIFPVTTNSLYTPLPGTTNILLDGSIEPSSTPNSFNIPVASTTGGLGSDLKVNIEGGTVTPTTINDLRVAFRLQEWLEKSARGGSRYIENMLVHFGVRSSDKRLQRAEYIYGTKSPVQISEVLNTTGTEDVPQGNMAGHGISVTSSEDGNYFCEEHGYLMCIMSILPDTAYQNGIPRHFLKINHPTELFWPSFAHLGEQPVYNDEIYAFSASGKETFGYQPRSAEYRYINSRVCGEFATTLDFWHMGRKFDTLPSLNAEFINAKPTHRVFAVIDENIDKMYCHIYHNIRAVRPIPKYGTPTF